MEVTYIGADYSRPSSSIAECARICHGNHNKNRLVNPGGLQDLVQADKNKATLIRCLDQGHYKVFEVIADCRFLFEGISRSCLAQLTTYRMRNGDLAESQRHVKIKDMDSKCAEHYVPPMPYLSKAKRAKAERLMKAMYKSSLEAYAELTKIGAYPEDARYVLTNAMPLTYQTSWNLAEFLFKVYPSRTALHAQDEIKHAVAEAMSALRSHKSFLFDNVFNEFMAYYLNTWLPKMRKAHPEWAV